MTKSQLDKIVEVRQELLEIYWQLVDNKEMREANRLDTIIFKLYYLHMIGNLK